MRSARVLVAWETPRQQDGGAAGRLAGPVESLTVNPNTGAMSSPLASLSKTRKVPLESEPVNPGRRGIRIYGDEDEVDMVNDGQDSEEKISLPSCYGGIGRQGLMIHDSELLTSMARKLQELEQQLKARNEEMLSKEQKILALEDLVQTLQQHQSSTTREEELETQCIQLQRQVGEMERFLNDYGLQWVGEPMDQENSEGKIISESDERDWMKAKKFWKPDRVSLCSPGCLGTHSVDQAGLNWEICLPLPPFFIVNHWRLVGTQPALSLDMEPQIVSWTGPVPFEVVKIHP
ncbi:UBX domain-containing protein 11 isoform X11 [Rattus norvegicus]|uniref:UBX domain-containing protein 11 isoform X11 n=1 Tax=Rattus norvegicus TaxID=10116 RepID=UPI002FD80D3A